MASLVLQALSEGCVQGSLEALGPPETVRVGIQLPGVGETFSWGCGETRG